VTELFFSIQFPKFDSSSKTLTLRPGIHVIYGESGVGKSHLCQSIVFGFNLAEKGSFEINQITPIERLMLVMQDPDTQIVAPSIYRELAFNLENQGWNSAEISSTIKKIVTMYNLTWNLERHPNTLSGGERELLNLITALSTKPDVLVIDDGFGFLSDSNKKAVIEILEDYCEKRDAVIVWITSNVLDIQYGVDSLELRLDKLSSEISYKKQTSDEWSPSPGKMLLKCRRFSFAYEKANPIFSNQNFTLGPFRSLAITGENGCGKTTLGYLLTGLLKASEGEVTLSYESGIIPKTGFLPQTPERFFGGHTLAEVVEELIQNKLFWKWKVLELKKALKDFQISWDLICNKPIHTLKISIIRVTLIVIIFLANYDMIVLDEPTFSLGERQKKKLIDFIRNFMDQKHLIFISHSALIAGDLCDVAVNITKSGIRQIEQSKGMYV